jgi:site-specific DNA-cytosine methylase
MNRKEYFRQYNQRRKNQLQDYYQKYHQQKKDLIKEAQIPWQKILVLKYWEQFIKEVSFQPKLTTNFFIYKSYNTIELQNWKKYGDIKKGIITFRHGNIRVKDKSIFPTITKSTDIPIVWERGQFRYITRKELLRLQNFPSDYQFPNNYSLSKICSLLGNSVDIRVIKDFVKDNQLPKNIKFVDLFAGIGGFHLALKDYGECVLANDIDKSCQKVYQLNFPTTPFSLGDINEQAIQRKIYAKEFDLLCAGFPCQPYSRVNKNKTQTDEVIHSLKEIIVKKRPKYVLLENVPQMKESFIFANYSLKKSLVTSKKQNRKRLLILFEKKLV